MTRRDATREDDDAPAGEWLTLPEAASRAGVSLRTVQRWARLNEVVSRVAPDGRREVRADSLPPAPADDTTRQEVSAVRSMSPRPCSRCATPLARLEERAAGLEAMLRHYALEKEALRQEVAWLRARVETAERREEELRREREEPPALPEPKRRPWWWLTRS